VFCVEVVGGIFGVLEEVMVGWHSSGPFWDRVYQYWLMMCCLCVLGIGIALLKLIGTDS
jgi:hypothetical protein